MKKFIIPAPQTISVPLDDLCQFLMVATGLCEVLDKKEVTALVITLFHAYKETYVSGPKNKSWRSNDPLYPSDSNIRVLFQYKLENEEGMSTTNLMKRSSDSIHSEACIHQAKKCRNIFSRRE